MEITKNTKSDFDEFLKEENLFDEVNELAIKRVLAYQLVLEMKKQKITKSKMAKLMHTSPLVVDRLLNPNSLTLNTLITASNVLGKKLNIFIS